jgi:hypothetical protein
MTLEKEAQRKSVVNMLGRHLNPMELARRMFSERYREVYNKIKDVDSEMRNKALENDPDIRDTLHKARMAYKNREYPKVVFYTWKILESMSGVFDSVDELEKFKETVIKDFYQSRGEQLSNEEFTQMNEALSAKPLVQGPVQMPKASKLEYLLYTAAAPDPSLPIGMVKQAGPVQWLKENIPTFTQMEGALLDRIFRNKMGKQREAARRALSIAENVHSSIKEMFKLLDAARTDFTSYISTARKFRDKFNQQKQELSTIYQTHFADIVPEKTETPAAPVPAAPAAPIEIATETPAKPPAVAPVVPAPAAPVAPVAAIPPPPPVEQMPESAEADWEFEENGPPTLTSAQMEEFRANMGKPAAQVINLWKAAKIEASRGDRGISAALLAKASEICDDNNDEADAKLLLQAAEKVLQG